MEHNFLYIAKTLKVRSTDDTRRATEDLLLDLCGLTGDDLVVDEEQLATVIADAYSLNNQLEPAKTRKQKKEDE